MKTDVFLYCAANFVGLSTEIPLSDAWRGLMAKGVADTRAAQRRRVAIESETCAELQRLVEALAQRRAALERLRFNVGNRIPALKQMAEDAYRLGRGSLLELIDAARSRLEARLTEVDLRAATAGQELRILGLAGRLGGQGPIRPNGTEMRARRQLFVPARRSGHAPLSCH